MGGNKMLKEDNDYSFEAVPKSDRKSFGPIFFML